MVDVVKHFTVDDLDDNGRPLVGSNEVLSVHFYDATEEDWLRDYTGLVNPFENADFSNTTVTGSAPGVAGTGWYETGTNAGFYYSNPSRQYFKIHNLPFDFADEVLAKYGTIIFSTPNVSDTPDRVFGDYFIDADIISEPKNDFPSDYNTTGNSGWESGGPWATSSGIPGGAQGIVAWSLSEAKTVSGALIDSYQGTSFTSDATAFNGMIAEYEIQVATTGTGLDDGDYTTVASGTRYNWGTPIWVEFTPAEANYIRLRFRNNGDVGRTNLWRFFVYEPEVISNGMGMAASKVHGSDTIGGGGLELQLNQDVDFTDIDKFYYDIVEYARDDSGYTTIKIDGSSVVIYDDPSQLSSTDMYYVQTGRAVDVSAFNGIRTIQLAKTMQDTLETSSDFLLISNITVEPRWYTESSSDTRAASKSFPAKTIIVSDATGLSIIDSSDMSLWMRFNLGSKRMLERSPTKIIAKEGKIYLGTTRGFYVIDFPNNKCVRFDDRGIYERHDIAKRNEHSFDRAVIYYQMSFPNPKRAIYAYTLESDAPTFDLPCILDFGEGYDDVYGQFFVLGTPTGLRIIKGDIDSSAVIYEGLSEDAVSHVRVIGNAIWYVQGEGSESRVHYIQDLTSISSSGFLPDSTYNQNLGFGDAFFNIGKDWQVVNRDTGITITPQGNSVAISGTKTRGGSNGLLHLPRLPDRSFTAKLDVKIKEFPGESRGGFRFGVGFNHFADGNFNGFSSDDGDDRRGVYISAHNVDPYGTPLMESNPWDYPTYEFNQGWVDIQQNYNDGGFQLSAPTVDGIKSKVYYSTNSTGDIVIIPGVYPTSSYLRRDLTAKLKVKLVQGFEPDGTTTSDSPGAFFGISKNEKLVPGTGVTTGNTIDGVMVVTGNTTYSGVLVYEIGSYDSSYLLSNITLSQPGIALGSNDNIGESSDYREWRLEYSAAEGKLDAYLDDEFVGTRSWQDSSTYPLNGIVFGQSGHAGSDFETDRIAWFTDLRVVYPELNESSKYRYGVELTNHLGKVSSWFSSPTYSGIANGSDTVPASGTLSHNSSLHDGNLHSGSSVNMGQDVSLGVGFYSSQLVDGIRLYDTASGTSGWNSSAAKTIELWTSSDNSTWTSQGTYDFNNVERHLGITTFRISPAIEADYFKLTGVDSTFTVAGGSAWAVSEIAPMVASGIEFYGNDNTGSADFREWRLEYDQPTKTVRGYIDDIQITEATFEDGLHNAQVVIADDITYTLSGTNTFDIEFKNFSIEFGDTPIFPAGEITGFSATGSTVSGTQENHTVIVATVSGVSVLDKDVSITPLLPDKVVNFDSAEALFGDSRYSQTVLAETAVTRGDGFMFIGTTHIVPSSYRVRKNRLFWRDAKGDAFGDSGAQVPTINYGNRTSLIYIPGTDKFYLIFDQNASYTCLLDFDTGFATQLSRQSWKEVLSIGDQNGRLHTETADCVYSPLTKEVWFNAPQQPNGRQNLLTGEVTEVSDGTTLFETTTTTDNGAFAIDYGLHNNRVYYTYENIHVADVEDNELIASYTYGYNNGSSSESRGRWARAGNGIPWTHSAGNIGGAIASVYCDYNRSIYYIVQDISFWNTGFYFTRYHIDHDYMEVLGSRNEGVLSWPYTDASLFESGGIPFVITVGKTAGAAYDPIDKFVYFLVARGTEPQLHAYDVVSGTWVETGEAAPYTASRQWPSGEPGSRDTNSNLFVYDSKRDQFVLATGRGDSQGANYYVYKPKRDLNKIVFDYVPERDGLPSVSGTNHYHNTKGCLIGVENDNYSHFDRDFEANFRDPNNTEWGLTYGDYGVTISGTNPALHSAADVMEYYSGTATLDPVGEFEIRGKISLPSFSRSFFSNTSLDYPKIEFTFGVADLWGYNWTALNVGREDPDGYQKLDFRVGCSGIYSSGADFTLNAFARYSDGFNIYSYSPTQIARYEHVDSNKYNLGDAFSEEKEFILSYDYCNDSANLVFDGNDMGTIPLWRKFGGAGVRGFMGMESQMNDQTGAGKEWVVNWKDVEIRRPNWDRIEDGRLITSISGAVGEYYHEKTLSTVASGIPWVAEVNSYIPTHVRSSGYDYIATFAAVGDGTKLVELAAITGPSQKKQIAITGDLDNRHDRTTYLGVADHLWDDVVVSTFRIVHDVITETVSVYIDNSETAAIAVSYHDLPDYSYRHLYYGKVRYGDWEKVYDSPTVSGSWNFNDPDHTNGTDPPWHKGAFNSTAYFASRTEQTNALAIYDLDEGLGEVDVYAFYYGMGLDSVYNAPYTITCSGVSELPANIGIENAVYEVDVGVDEYGNSDADKVTVRVDQRRHRNGTGMSTNFEKGAASGWVHLGKFRNPSRVVLTADGDSFTSSTNPQVCADSIGVDIGKYGLSTFDMSVGYVRINVGSVEFPPVSLEPSGLTVIDLADGQVIDFYGSDTGPRLEDSNITTGTNLE